jgi:hypothetical protein
MIKGTDWITVNENMLILKRNIAKKYEAMEDWVFLRPLTTTLSEKEIDAMANHSILESTSKCKQKKLTQARLREVLDYDSETGVFTFRIDRGLCGKRGGVVGAKNSCGYLMICIDGIQLAAHRLAWLYTYGYIPENEIDHINRTKTDNRIENLREVSRSCNIRNRVNSKNNTSGIKGVSWAKERQQWIVRIMVNCREINIGRFDDFSEAACARLAAEQCVDWSGCDSSSSAYKYVRGFLK